MSLPTRILHIDFKENSVKYQTRHWSAMILQQFFRQSELRWFDSVDSLFPIDWGIGSSG